MHLGQLDWFTLAIFASIASSLTEVFKKAVLKNSNIHPIAFGVYFNVLVSIVSLPFAFSSIISLHLNYSAWILTLIMGIMYAISNIFYYNALKMTEVSQVGIISSSRSIWLLIGGLIFLGERVNAFEIAGVILIVLGIIIIYWNGKGLADFGTPQIFLFIFAIVSCVPSIIGTYLLDNYFNNVALYQVLSYFLPAVFNIIFMPSALIKIKPLLKIDKNNIFVMISASLTAAAIFMYFSAFKAGGQLSVVGPIWQASIILTVVCGILFLNEKQKLLKKLSSVVIVVIGICLMRFV